MRSFPAALGQSLDSVRHLRGPELDDVAWLPEGARIADPERWRSATFLLSLVDSAVNVRLGYRADTRQLWSIAVAEPTGRVPLRLGEVDLRADLGGVVEALGPADYEAQIAPIVREHHWLRGDVTCVAEALTSEETIYEPTRHPGFLKSISLCSASLGPPDYERWCREAHLLCCYVGTELPLEDFAASLGRLLALPTTELGTTFNRASATLGREGGSPGLRIVEYRVPTRLLELQIEGAPGEEALALAGEMRRHGAALGRLL